MPQPELRAIVTRMVEAGESEENIGAVIRRLSAAPVAAPAPDFRTTNATKPDGSPVVADYARFGPMQGMLQAQAEGGTRAGAAAVNLAKGAGAGAASTVYHGGDLIRRGLGMDRVIERPEVQAAMTPPSGRAGRVGFLGEQAAEFAVPLSRVAKVTKGLPILKRMAGEAVASAGVAGIQSGGDTGQMGVAAAFGGALPAIGRGVGAAARAGQRMAAGAAEGGIGGAMAGAIRTAAPSSSKTMLIQGLKPEASRRGFAQGLDRALPELKATEAELGKAIEGIDDLLKATGLAKKRVWSQYEAIAGPRRAMGSTLDLTPVADRMVASIPSKVKLESPERAAKILARADIYRKRFKLEDAEQLLKETNSELDGFYGKYPMAQRKALASNPKVAALESQAAGLRETIDTFLDDATEGAAPREIKRRYGALLEIERSATKRANVAARQQPENLSEQIGKVRAAADMARGGYKLMTGQLSGAADIAAARGGREMATFLKEQQTTDALVRRAFQSFKGAPVPVKGPVPRPIRGLLPKGSVIPEPPADTSGRIAPTLPENISRPRMAPEPMAAPKPAVPDDVPDFDLPVESAADTGVERSFMLRWLQNDLAEMPFQQGGSTLKGRRVAYESLDPKEAHALTFNPHVAGTPTQEMFHAMGLTGSREVIARKLTKAIHGRNKNPKLDALADAMREAWDGQRFDWDLVSDETVARVGIRRKDFRGPVTMADDTDMPEAFARVMGGGEK